MAAPPCRGRQYMELLNALQYDIPLVIVSGPLSSGKTVTIKAVIETLRSQGPICAAHVFCETDNTVADILTDIVSQLTATETRARSISSIPKFLRVCPRDSRCLVVLDSFELLEQQSAPLFQKLAALVDQRILPSYSFVFVCHCDPQFFCFAPLTVYSVLFPAYSKSDIVTIVSTTLSRPKEVVAQVFDICAPVSCDIRDVVFVVHTLGDRGSAIWKEVLSILDTMHNLQLSRINDLARTAAALLLGSYIGSKTTIASDLLKFARTVSCKRKEPKMLEDHDTIPFERAFALAKAIIHAHLGEFQTDFSISLQLQKLVELGLLEIRGDIYGDPRVKCLATEQEISAVAAAYDIKIHEYVPHNSH